MSDVEYETGRCDRHDTVVPIVTKSFAEANGLPYGCPPCRDEMLHGRDVATMTPDERATEVRAILEANCWAGFDAVWHRIDELVGRGTYTHELAAPSQLCAEIMGEGRLDPVESLRSLTDKPIIVVDASER